MLVEDIIKEYTRLLPKGWSLKSATYKPHATYTWKVTIQNDEHDEVTATGHDMHLIRAFHNAAAMVRLPHEE